MKKTAYTLLFMLAVVNLQAHEDGIIPPEEDEVVVGAIGGTVDVSALGGATYTIPIQVPDGVNGMQPSLSVVYNNQSGNGLLGWNWGLGGLSAITRINQTEYHDGQLKPVNFQNDRFALDGQRLIVLNGASYGGNGTYYVKEADDMTEVISYDVAGVDGTGRFEVWMANGVKSFYGSHGNSRVMLQNENNVCIWLLDSVVDRCGNYMTYEYEKGDSHYVLSKIKYSGNTLTGQEPIYTVRLIYDGRVDKEISFIGDYRLNYVRLLKQINVSCGNVNLHQYLFDYFTVDCEYIYHRLKTIDYICGEYRYKPTLISWDSDGSSNTGTHKVDFTNGGNLDKTTVKFTGDFNGDGLTDVLAADEWNQHGYYTKAKLYINDGVANDGVTVSFRMITEFKLGEFINWIYVADYNGDGLDDIMFANREERTGWFERDRVTLDFYFARLNSGVLSFIKKDTPYPNHGDCFKVSRKKRDYVLVGDFTGEGKQSVFIEFYSINKDDEKGEESTEGVDALFWRSCLIRYENGRLLRYTSRQVIDADKIYPADYDGDGRTEFLYKTIKHGETKVDRLRVINGVLNDFGFEVVYSGSPHNWEECYPGDFNGDGKTDALFYNKNGNSFSWIIYLFKSNGFSWENYHCPYLESDRVSIYHDHFTLRKPSGFYYGTKHHLKIADFNGDGKADIAYVNADEDIYIDYGGMRNQSSDAPFAWEQHISRKYFSWFSSLDMCIGNFFGIECAQFLGSNHISHVAPLSRNYTVKAITDGMGNCCMFYYGRLVNNPLSTDNVYSMTGHGQTQGNDIRHVALPIKVVKSVKQYNLGNNALVNEARFEYRNLLLHRKGHGVLGFRSIIKRDYVANVLTTRSVSNYEIQTMGEHCGALPSSNYVYDGDDVKISETHFTFRKYVNNISNGKIAYMVVPGNQITDSYELIGNRNFLRRRISEYQYQSDLLYPWYAHSVRNTYSIVGSDDSFVENASECEFQTKIETAYYDNNLNSWVINRPKVVIQTQSRLGNYENKTSKTEYEYNSFNPYQASKVTTTTNGDVSKATFVMYEYDEYGNVLEQEDRAVIGYLSRKKTYEYSPDGRFLLKETADAGFGNLYNTDYLYNNVFGYRVKSTDCNGFGSYFKNDDHLGITTQTYRLDPDNNYIGGSQTVTALRWVYGSDYAVYVTDLNKAEYFSWTQSSGQRPAMTYYDASGRELRTVTFGMTKSDAIYHDIQYDWKGRVSKRFDPYFAVDGLASAGYTQMEYDNYDRVTKTIYKDCNGAPLQVGEVVYDGLQTITTTYRNECRKQMVSDKLNVMGWKVEHVDYINPDDPDNPDSRVVVNYNYNADGSLAWTMVNSDVNTKITMDYDATGNRVGLFDPDYGYVTSQYDAFGQLCWTVTPKGDLTEFEYDRLGRTITRTETDIEHQKTVITSWMFSEDEGKRGLLNQINHDTGGQVITYEYDELNRPISVSKTMFGETYTTSYEYDNLSRVFRTQYPSGYKTKNIYDGESGMRIGIKDNDGKWLWKLHKINSSGQVTEYQTGDGTVSARGYDNMHRLHTQFGMNGDRKIQDFIYEYDEFSNLASRTENKYDEPLMESFTYDKLNRLDSIILNGVVSTMAFDEYGRILSKMRDGQIVFDNAQYETYDGQGNLKPHAISGATKGDCPYPDPSMVHSVDYTMFDKVQEIVLGYENNYRFDYGYDHERIRMTYIKGGVSQMQKIYVDNCEFINMYGHYSNTYLVGPLGVFAVVTKSGQNESIHYVYKDHLGSWTTITDEEGDIVQEQSFDAWGNRRNPYTWQGLSGIDFMFDRGFTGHEHLFVFDAPWKDAFINMNGRVYDPVMSSFLSVDNYVQSPDNSQSFNRYAYCLNNPLKYTDPSGEIAITSLIMAAGIGAFMNLAMNMNNIKTEGDFFGTMAFGAASGVLGAYVGGVVAEALPFAGFYGGAVSGSAGGAAGGFVNGFGNAGLAGCSVGESLVKGFLESNIGAVTGGLMEGTASGLGALLEGYSFMKGERAFEYSGDGIKLEDMYPNKNFNYERYISDISGEDARLVHRAQTYMNSEEVNTAINVDRISTDASSRGYYVKRNGTYKTPEGGTAYGVSFRVRNKPNFTEFFVSPYAASHPETAIFIATIGHEYTHCLHMYWATLGITDITSANSEWEATNYSAEVFDYFGMNEVADAFRTKMNNNPLKYIQNTKCQVPSNFPFSLDQLYYRAPHYHYNPLKPWY